jgi:hypothetical protein
MPWQRSTGMSHGSSKRDSEIVAVAVRVRGHRSVVRVGQVGEQLAGVQAAARTLTYPATNLRVNLTPGPADF